MKIFDDIKTGLNQAIEFERKNHDNKANTSLVEKCEDIEVDNHSASIKASQNET